MLKYGEAYLEQNEVALERLLQGMSDEAKAVARAMAPDQDEDQVVDEDELEAA